MAAEAAGSDHGLRGGVREPGYAQAQRDGGDGRQDGAAPERGHHNAYTVATAVRMARGQNADITMRMTT